MIENFVVDRNRGFIAFRRYLTVRDLYLRPLESSKLNIFRESNLECQLEFIPIEQVFCKMFRFPIPNCEPQNFAVFPISREEENLTH